MLASCRRIVRRAHVLPLLLLCMVATGCPFDLLSSSGERAVRAALVLTPDPQAVTLAPGGSRAVTLALQGGEEVPHVLSQVGGSGGDVQVTLPSGGLRPGASTAIRLAVAPSIAVPTLRVVRLEFVARNGTDSARTAVNVTLVPPFEASVAGAFTNAADETLSGTVTLVRADGFTGAVALRFVDLPAGWTATIPPSTTGSTEGFTIAVPRSAATGFYVFTLEASAGGTTRSMQIAARVLEPTLPPDIIVAAAPDSVRVEAGTAAEWLVSVARTAPGIGSVSMSVAGLPVGAAATFTPNPVTDTTRLRVVTDVTTPAGSYPVIVTGTAGALVRSDTVLLYVDVPRTLAISLTPRTVSIPAGGSGTTTVQTQTTGAVGAITFDAPSSPAGITSTFSLVGADRIMSIAVDASVAPGNYTVVARAQAGALSARDSITVEVTAARSLALALSPTEVTIAAGSAGSVQAVVQSTGAVGPITFDAPTVPAGITATFSTVGAVTTLTIDVAESVVPGDYLVVARAQAGALAAVDSLAVRVTASIGGFTLTMPQALALASGTSRVVKVGITRAPAFANVSLQANVTTQPPGGRAWVAPTATVADSMLVQIVGGSVGTYPVTVVVTGGGVTRTAVILVSVFSAEDQDFTLTPLPVVLNMERGAFTPMSLLLERVMGHTGVVSFSALTDSPGNYVVEFTPESSTASGNAVIGVRVYASPNVAPGPHLLVLRGTVGGVVRTAVVTLNIF